MTQNVGQDRQRLPTFAPGRQVAASDCCYRAWMVFASTCSSGETCRQRGGRGHRFLQCWSAERSASGRSSTILCSAFFLLAVLACESAAAITLSRAQQELLANNADLALAEAAVDGAAANVLVAGQPQNPTLSVSTAQYSPIGGLGPGRPTDKLVDTIVGISIPIERGDKAALKRDQALGQLSGARHDLRDSRRQQRLGLHQIYYDLKLAEEKRALAGRSWDLSLQALAAADKRVAAGDLAAVDRYRLSVEALRSANDVISADAEMRQMRIALAIAMGRKPEGSPGRESLRTDDLSADDAWPAPAIDDSNAPADATSNATSSAASSAASNATSNAASSNNPPTRPARYRADVAAAAARVAAADAGRAVARSLRTRDVTVGAQIERVPAGSPGLTFGVSMSIPLFARYAYEGEIARAEADYTTAVLMRQKTINQAEAESAKAAALLYGARQRLSSFEADIQPAAKRALDAIEFAYARGASGLTDVLDARRTWHATAVDLAVARADYAKALAAWRAATQWESVADDKP